MAGLASDTIAEFLKHTNRFALADAGQLGISDSYFRSARVLLGGGFLGVFFRHFQPELDGFADILERLFLGAPLAPAARQRGTLDGKALLRFNQQHSIFHPPKFSL